MLVTTTLDGCTYDKVQIAIERLRAFEPLEGYWGGFSGGKDSQTIHKLAELAEISVEWHFSVTTVDPPELVRFIRAHYPDVIFDHPEKTMWQLIESHGIPPTRLARFCCEYLKERGGEGRVVVTGVRWAESARRSKRQMAESCYRKSKRYVHPIIDWSDEDVWEFHRLYGLPHCCLYDEGWPRIGCVLCPMNRNRKRDAERWPRIANNYLKACRRAYARSAARGKVQRWQNGDEMYAWWMSDVRAPAPGQLRLDEECDWGAETGDVSRD